MATIRFEIDHILDSGDLRLYTKDIYNGECLHVQVGDSTLEAYLTAFRSFNQTIKTTVKHNEKTYERYIYRDKFDTYWLDNWLVDFKNYMS